MVIYFRYEADTEKRKQADLNTQAAAHLTRLFSQPSVPSLLTSDFLPHLAALRPTERNPSRTLLEKHLTDYTARNTFDYFIHKDLGGFLRRELDFYIKNEVMHLDDVESEAAPRVEQYLSKIKAIRRIAHKIINFLAQIENFQKKLWLKKKFVVETQYCVTLDQIFAIEDAKARDWLVDQIIGNDDQREEWVNLCAIDELEGGLDEPGYSKPLKRNFLKAHPTLMVDTRHFDEDFKRRLLASFHDLDEMTDGVLLHSESFHALQLLGPRYRGAIDVALIDPPYNMGTDDFVYKDNYQRSSWLTMAFERFDLLRTLLREDGLLGATIDDHELHRLGWLLNEVFGEDCCVASAPWKSEASGGKEKTGPRTGHEYLLIYHNGSVATITQDERSTGDLDKRDRWGPYRKGRELRKWGGTSLRSDRPGQWYALRVPNGEEVWPIRNDGKEGHWRWGLNNKHIQEALKDPEVFH